MNKYDCSRKMGVMSEGGCAERPLPIRHRRSRGAVAVEFAMVAVMLIVVVFFIIDFAMLIRAKLVATSTAFGGVQLASRSTVLGQSLVDMLLASSAPLDLLENGIAYVSVVYAGSSGNPEPRIALPQYKGGKLTSEKSRIGGPGDVPKGLDWIKGHLTYNDAKKTSDISGVVVVEIYYAYNPITPIRKFLPSLIWGGSDGDSVIVGSQAVVQLTK